MAQRRRTAAGRCRGGHPATHAARAGPGPRSDVGRQADRPVAGGPALERSLDARCHLLPGAPAGERAPDGDRLLPPGRGPRTPPPRAGGQGSHRPPRCVHRGGIGLPRAERRRVLPAAPLRARGGGARRAFAVHPRAHRRQPAVRRGADRRPGAQRRAQARRRLAAGRAGLADRPHHSRHRADPDRPADREPRRRGAARAADRGGERRGVLGRGDRRDAGARRPGGRGDLRSPGAARAVHHQPRQPRLARRHRRQPLCLRARHVPGGAGQPRLRGTARRMAGQDRRARGTGLRRQRPRHRRPARRPLRGGAPVRPQREVLRAGGAQCAQPATPTSRRHGCTARRSTCCHWPGSTIPPRPSCACCCRAASPSS